MAKRRKRDPLAPLLKMLRAYLLPEDLHKEHKQFLAEVADRIKSDTRAYKRLRKNMSAHTKLRREVPV